MNAAVKNIWLVPVGIVMLLLILMLLDVQISIIILDFTFMAGLILFIIGGFLWIIDQGVFDGVFRIFKQFLKRTSKMEAFVDEQTAENQYNTEGKSNKSFPFIILIAGIVLISASTLLSIF